MLTRTCDLCGSVIDQGGAQKNKVVFDDEGRRFDIGISVSEYCGVEHKTITGERERRVAHWAWWPKDVCFGCFASLVAKVASGQVRICPAPGSPERIPLAKEPVDGQ